MRTPDGRCDNNSCPYRTNLGFCPTTSCINNSSTTITYTSNDLNQVLDLSGITDDGMRKCIERYLQSHTVKELLQIISDII